MCLTREQWNMHKEAIEWFYEQPEGTEIWWRFRDSKCSSHEFDWYLTDNPNWYNDIIYIINDEYAELRKAIVDSKEIEFKDDLGNWIVEECENVNPNTYDFYYPPERFRIKSGIRFPVFQEK